VLSDPPVDALGRILRHTALSAIVVGAVVSVGAIIIGAPAAVIGIAIGVGVAILNVRVLGNGVLNVETDGTTDNKVVRRLLRTNSAVRLAVITAITIGLVIVATPVGIGVAVGLVIFQLCFVVSAGRVVRATRVL
jgi:hypothetical protein